MYLMTTIKAQQVRPGMVIRFSDAQIMGVVSVQVGSGQYGLIGVDGEIVWLHNSQSVVLSNVSELKAQRAARKAAEAARKAATHSQLLAGLSCLVGAL